MIPGAPGEKLPKRLYEMAQSFDRDSSADRATASGDAQTEFSSLERLAEIAARTAEGTGKVAALLLAMGRQAAASLLQQFEAQEIRVVTKAAAELPPLSAQDLESIVEEFAQQFSMGANILGALGGLETVLNDVLSPEQVNSIMSDLFGTSSKSVWERVSSVSENSLASYLSKEHPQTAALVLSKVKPSCAAKVMSQLPSSLRNELMRRVLSLKPIVDDAMRVVEKMLHEDLTLNFARNLGADTYARVADIINKMERS